VARTGFRIVLTIEGERPLHFSHLRHSRNCPTTFPTLSSLWIPYRPAFPPRTQAGELAPVRFAPAPDPVSGSSGKHKTAARVLALTCADLIMTGPRCHSSRRQYSTASGMDRIQGDRGVGPSSKASWSAPRHAPGGNSRNRVLGSRRGRDSAKLPEPPGRGRNGNRPVGTFRKPEFLRAGQ
jgi:hypothetical protein